MILVERYGKFLESLVSTVSEGITRADNALKQAASFYSHGTWQQAKEKGFPGLQFITDWTEHNKRLEKVAFVSGGLLNGACLALSATYLLRGRLNPIHLFRLNVLWSAAIVVSMVGAIAAKILGYVCTQVQTNLLSMVSRKGYVVKHFEANQRYSDPRVLELRNWINKGSQISSSMEPKLQPGEQLQHLFTSEERKDFIAKCLRCSLEGHPEWVNLSALRSIINPPKETLKESLLSSFLQYCSRSPKVPASNYYREKVNPYLERIKAKIKPHEQVTYHEFLHYYKFLRENLNLTLEGENLKVLNEKVASYAANQIHDIPSENITCTKLEEVFQSAKARIYSVEGIIEKLAEFCLLYKYQESRIKPDISNLLTALKTPLEAAQWEIDLQPEWPALQVLIKEITLKQVLRAAKRRVPGNTTLDKWTKESLLFYLTARIEDLE